jgi:hypothetical protein
LRRAAVLPRNEKAAVKEKKLPGDSSSPVLMTSVVVSFGPKVAERR